MSEYYEENNREPGDITYYVSVGVEKNSRSINTSFKASVWITSGINYSWDQDRIKLTKAQALASSAAVLGANALEQLANETMNQDDINAFKEAVKEVAHQMIARESEAQKNQTPLFDESEVPF